MSDEQRRVSEPNHSGSSPAGSASKGAEVEPGVGPAGRPAGAAVAEAPAPKPAAAKPAPKPGVTKPAAAPAAAESANVGGIARRKIVWWSVFGFIFVCLLATLKFFFPRAIFEPKTRFRIGYPADYGFGVSTKWQAAQRIWVVRDSGGLYVIFAKCTHLGCTPDWKETENKFKCPCHGSGFDTEGVNFEGPAPRPLERLYVELDAEGQIVVDKSRVYGGATLAESKAAWQREGAYIAV